MVKKADLKNFIREHKGEIITAVTIIGAIAVECFQNLSNKTELESDFEDADYLNFSDEEIVDNLIDVNKEDPLNERLIKVNSHIRNLPKGMRASPEKSALAEELEIDLDENQTLVNEYKRRCG